MRVFLGRIERTVSQVVHNPEANLSQQSTIVEVRTLKLLTIPEMKLPMKSTSKCTINIALTTPERQSNMMLGVSLSNAIGQLCAILQGEEFTVLFGCLEISIDVGILRLIK